MWLFKQRKSEPEPISVPVDPVVDEAKRRTHIAANAAKQGADRLNMEFVENHITLTILRTAGGKKSGR